MATKIFCAYDTDDFKNWILTRQFKRDGITIPKGFVWDGASVPRWFWSIVPRWGRFSSAALIHDYLYATGGKHKDLMMTRDEVDNLFYRHMIEDGTAKWRAWIIWFSVHLFGKSRFFERPIEQLIKKV